MNNNSGLKSNHLEKINTVHRIRGILLFVGIAFIALLVTVIVGRAAGTEKVFQSGLYEYIILNEKDKTAEIVGFSGSSKDLILPDTIDGMIITSIGERVFSENDTLQKVTIPNSVTRIGAEAFIGCESLQEVEIPNSVTYIGDEAFECSDLKEVRIPNSVTTIGAYAFYECFSLKTVEISHSVTTIEEGTFARCLSLKEVVIPNSVTTIGEEAFAQCESLNEVIIPESVTTIEPFAFILCRSLEKIVIPNTVSIIGWSAFRNCQITSLYLPRSLSRLQGLPFDFADDYDIYYSGKKSEWDQIEYEKNYYDDAFEYSKEHIEYEQYDDWFDSTYNDWLKHLHFDYDYDSDDNPFYILGYKHYHNLDYYATNHSSSVFDNELCRLMACIAVSAYDKTDIQGAYSALGFSEWERYNLGIGTSIDISNPSKNEDSNLEYTIGKKEAKDGTTIVLVDIRGSVSVEDWLRDFSVSKEAHNYSVHSGFQEASNAIYDTLMRNAGDSANLASTKYFITGHSLGAAVSNLLSVKMSQPGKQNVYCYDFACPDTVAVDLKDWVDINPFNNQNGHDNIFNICNDEDIVAYVPGKIGSLLLSEKNALDIKTKNTTYQWGKFGITKWFEDGVTTKLTVDVHDQYCYLDIILHSTPKYYDSYQHPEQDQEDALALTAAACLYTHPAIHMFVWTVALCPVDIAVINETGKTIAYTKNDVAYYVETNEDVVLMVLGDRKAVVYPDYKDYSIVLSGTGKGEMTLITGSCNGDTIDKVKVFQNVSLTVGKAMISDLIENNPTDTKLYVINENEELIKEIHEDGTEINVAEQTLPRNSSDNSKEKDRVDPVLNGIVKGSDGKWAMYKNGKVNTSYTGIAKNQYGWWRVKDGYVDFNANGIYKNEYGWWKTTNGKVTFKETGIFKNEYGWWRVEKSKVNFKANSIYKNQYGWWKTTGGKVTFKENGVFKNEYGWWKVKNSKVDFSFTGISKNQYGSWYVKDGKVDFDKNGKVIHNNYSYTIKNGKVQ